MDNKGENGLTGKHACVRVVVESERIAPLCCYGKNLVLFGFGFVTTIWDLVPSGISREHGAPDILILHPFGGSQKLDPEEQWKAEDKTNNRRGNGVRGTLRVFKQD
uniref:Uncharacterized protein n=1 Tax=Moniliophthora roreri TaxID=221103 RepID=A0A0W0FSK1_MONRR